MSSKVFLVPVIKNIIASKVFFYLPFFRVIKMQSPSIERLKFDLLITYFNVTASKLLHKNGKYIQYGIFISNKKLPGLKFMN